MKTCRPGVSYVAIGIICIIAAAVAEDVSSVGVVVNFESHFKIDVVHESGAVHTLLSTVLICSVSRSTLVNISSYFDARVDIAKPYGR